MLFCLAGSAGKARAQTLGMVIDPATKVAVVFDTETDALVGHVQLPSPQAHTPGDCALWNEYSPGFLTDQFFKLFMIDFSTTPPQATPPIISISNSGEDVAISADGSYLVACGRSGFHTVSVVDTALRAEVGTFNLGSECTAIDVCDDGSVLVSSSNADRVRRLALQPDGQLQDTGEFLQIDTPLNVNCSPGSASGVVIKAGPSGIQSFSVPGLAPVASRSLDALDLGYSLAIHAERERLFVRTGAAIVAYSFNSATGALGPSSLLTIPFPIQSSLPPSLFGIERMALDPPGNKLYVPGPGEVRVYDAATGSQLGRIPSSALVVPRGVCIVRAPDTDDDGLDDLDEGAVGSDPLDPDSDDDGLRDGFEVECGFDPLAPGEEAQDPDGDGLDNLVEQEVGTDPGDADTDGDGLEDGHEVLVAGTSPLRADTDADGDADGFDNCPLTANADQADVVHPNGIGDACEDPDADGIVDSLDNCPDTMTADLQDGDGDGLGNACDPFPDISLRVRMMTLLSATAGGQPTPLHLRLEDAVGVLQDDLVGVRATLTLGGTAVFDPAASAGVLVSGGGTSRALVEFVNGGALLAIRDGVPQLVEIGGLDSERFGLTVLPTSIHFRAGGPVRDSLAMVLGQGSSPGVVFDTETDAILGVVPGLGTATAGDCALSSDVGGAFATAGARVWAVDLTTTPPQLENALDPIAIANPGLDAAMSPDARFLVVTYGLNASTVSVVDTVRGELISTALQSSRYIAVDVCGDNTVLLASSANNHVRRLTLTAEGTLQSSPPFGALGIPNTVNVACAPHSKVGVVIGSDRILRAFRIADGTVVSTRTLSGTAAGVSIDISPLGDRVYARSNNAVDAFSLDPETGALGSSPVFTVPLPAAAGTVFPGIDQMALDRAGRKLYVPLPGSVSILDAATGALLGTILHPSLVSPTGICRVTLRDADDDGLSDRAEEVLGSDPSDPDTDGDGLLDGFEADHGFLFLVAGEQGEDPDGDGLDNLEEQTAGTRPNDPDSDDDGLSDSDELLNTGTDPNRPDTDADGRLDGLDFCPFDPLDDLDADGVCGNVDLCPALADPGQLDLDSDRIGDACDVCPAVSNPLQDEQVGCLAFVQNGGQCLEARVDLIPGVQEGRLTIVPGATSVLLTRGQVPGLVDISARAPGTYSLCLEALDGPPARQLFGSTSSGQLIRINTVNGVSTLVGSLPSPAADIEYDFASGRAFLVTNRELREFDIDTGAAVGPVRGTSLLVASLEFVGSTLYGVAVNVAGGEGELRTINPETGTAIFVGFTGTPVLTGLAWDEAQGVMYGVTGGSGLSDLVTVNLTTGATVRVGSTGHQLGSLQFSGDGFLIGAGVGTSTGRLIRINPATGVGTQVGVTGFGDITGLTRVHVSECMNFTKTTEEALAINGAACGGPTALASAAASVECTSALGASVTLDGTGSSDPNSTPGTQDDIVSYEWLENPAAASPALLGTGPVLTVALSLGTHDLGLRVTDSFGETDTDEFQVAVVDTVAPALTLGVTPLVLWPPNHRMMGIDATPAATDLCSTPAVTLHAITNSEPDDAEGNGDGSTADDIQKAANGTLDRAFELRAERDGTGNGRFYTVLYRAVDAAGNASWAESVVTVPHNQDGTTEPLTLQVRQNGAGTLVSWGEVSGALYYNVIRGRVRQIADAPSAIDLGPVSCLASRVTGHGTIGTADTASPAAGDIFFYLAEYHDGWRASSYGTAEAHAPVLPGPGACP